MSENNGRLESRINTQQNEIMRLREKYAQLLSKHSQLESDHRSTCSELESMKVELKQTKDVLSSKQDAYTVLEAQSKNLQSIIDSQQRVVDWQGSIGQSRSDLLQKERADHKAIHAELLASNAELDLLKIAKTIAEHEQEVLSAKLAASEQQTRTLTSLHDAQSTDFLAQIAKMAETIELLTRTINERDALTAAIREQQEVVLATNSTLNNDLEFESADDNAEDICGDYDDENAAAAEADFSHDIEEEEQKQTPFGFMSENVRLVRQEVKQLVTENTELSSKLYEQEQQFVKRMQEIEGQLAAQTARIQELEEDKKQLEILVQKSNGNDKDANANVAAATGSQRTIEDVLRDSRGEQQQQQQSGLSASDAKILQSAYETEVKCRGELQKTLAIYSNEMRAKNPILKRQTERWNQMNIDFIQLEEKLTSNIAALAEMEESLRKESGAKEELEREAVFMKQEIARLASQISHLLKVNFKLKERVAAKLGKPVLEEIIDDIRKDLARAFELSEVDAFYQRDFTSLFSDIPQMVEFNMDLARQLARRK